MILTNSEDKGRCRVCNKLYREIAGPIGKCAACWFREITPTSAELVIEYYRQSNYASHGPKVEIIK